MNVEDPCRKGLSFMKNQETTNNMEDEKRNQEYADSYKFYWKENGKFYKPVKTQTIFVKSKDLDTLGFAIDAWRAVGGKSINQIMSFGTGKARGFIQQMEVPYGLYSDDDVDEAKWDKLTPSEQDYITEYPAIFVHRHTEYGACVDSNKIYDKED